MPWYTCYVLKRMPRRLLYANGVVDFEIVEEPWLVDGNYHWVFRARRIQALESTCTIAASADGKWHLQQKLAAGFVPEGMGAVKIMERLVREGYALKSQEKFSR